MLLQKLVERRLRIEHVLGLQVGVRRPNRGDLQAASHFQIEGHLQVLRQIRTVLDHVEIVNGQLTMLPFSQSLQEIVKRLLRFPDAGETKQTQ